MSGLLNTKEPYTLVMDILTTNAMNILNLSLQTQEISAPTTPGEVVTIFRSLISIL